MDLDIIIEHGTVIDGTGAAGFRADVGIVGVRIAAVGDLSARAAGRRIDAAGCAVAPGFIDMHSHSDLSLLADPQGASMVRQGVTTQVTGNCGLSPAPLTAASRGAVRQSLSGADAGLAWDWESFGEFLARLAAAGPALNVVPLVGHCALRGAVMGFGRRPPTPAELRGMQDLLARCMDEGAWGFSTGLVYPPSMYGDTDEIVALAEVAARRGGLYSTHMRGESRTVVRSVQEAIEVARRSGVNTEISHHKAAFRENWGKVKETLPLLEEAARSTAIAYDCYPYTAGSAGLSQLVPPWAHDGGPAALLESLQDATLRRRIHHDMAHGTPDWDNWAPVDWQDITISYVGSAANKAVEGRTVQESADAAGQDPIEWALDLILAEGNRVSMINAIMCEEDVRRVLAHPLATIGSDGRAVTPGGRSDEGKCHPRYYGTFPRVLGLYCREEKLLGLEEAIHKMTGQAAEKLGLKDRGRLREGLAADVTVFDPARVKDRATFAEPNQFPVGIAWVLVNGGVVVEGGQQTSLRPGRVLC